MIIASRIFQKHPHKKNFQDVSETPHIERGYRITLQSEPSAQKQFPSCSRNTPNCAGVLCLCTRINPKDAPETPQSKQEYSNCAQKLLCYMFQKHTKKRVGIIIAPVHKNNLPGCSRNIQNEQEYNTCAQNSLPKCSWKISKPAGVPSVCTRIVSKMFQKLPN